MKKKSPLLILICTMYLLNMSLSGCGPYPIYDQYIVDQSRQKENLYYVTSAPNTQLLTEKNDLDLNLMSSGGTKFSGTEAQASFVAAKHIGLIGSYSNAKNSGGLDYMKYNRFETGAGYITKLSKGWHFETYAGIGTGKITNFHQTGNSQIKLTHFFLQPGIAISNSKQTLQLGFVSKFSGVHFNIDTAFDTAREPFSASQAKSLYAQPFHVMWDPGFILRFGWRHFLFHTSYSFSSDFTNTNLYGAKSNFSLGASLRLNTGRKEASK